MSKGKGLRVWRHTPESFWALITKTEGCWVWNRNRLDGYGSLTYQGKHVMAHRLAWQLTNGEIPKGLQIDHLCRNRACVNPEHMEVVTLRENIKRGAQNVYRNGTCRRGHDISVPRNLYINPLGIRFCRECQRIRQRAHYAQDPNYGRKIPRFAGVRHGKNGKRNGK